MHHTGTTTCRCVKDGNIQVKSNPEVGDVLTINNEDGSISYYTYDPNNVDANSQGYVGAGVQSKKDEEVVVKATRTNHLNGVVGDVLGFVEKHFNGGLGYGGVAVKAYNKIPNNVKRHYAYELSKNIIDAKPGEIFQGTKRFVNGTGRVIGKLGTAGTILTGGVIAYDLLDDGRLKASSIINGTLIGVGLAFPITAPFVLAYGIIDYKFGINDMIDKKAGTLNTHIYD